MFMHKLIKIFKKFQEIGPVSLFIRIWISATPRPNPNDIWQSLGLHLVNINVHAKFQHNILHSSRDMAISLFQNLELGKASIDRNVSSQSLVLDLVNINVYAKFIKIFHSVQEIGSFSLFKNLALGKASTDDKCHFAIPWARSFQHQIVCKILSKYSKMFNIL